MAFHNNIWDHLMVPIAEEKKTHTISALNTMRRVIRYPLLLLVFLLALFTLSAPVLSQTDNHGGESKVPPQFDVLTRSYNLRRNSVNHQEHVLHPDNVNKDSFGRLFSRKVDGHVYAQVLYAHNVPTHARGVKNLIFVATMSNKVYAFDADDPDADEPIWKLDLGPPVPLSDRTLGRKCVLAYYQDKYRDIYHSVGVVSTPVIDRSTYIMYVVNMNKDGAGPSSYRHRIRGIDIRSGRAVLGPEIINLQVPGVGVGSSKGVVSLYPLTQLQRSSLALYDGVVYFGFGAFCDTNPYHGWIAGYDARTLDLRKVWCSTPNDKEGSVWNAGEGITIDEDTGNLMVVTANGYFDAGRQSYGSAFVVLDSKEDDENGMMKVVGYSKPDDDELGVLGVLHMPETGYMITASKNAKLWIVDPNRMTMDNSDDAIVRMMPFPKHVHGTPVWWKRNNDNRRFVYLWGMYDRPRQFELVDDGGGRMLLSNYSDYPDRPFSSFPGGFMTLSSDGTSDSSAIVWAWVPIGEQLFGRNDSNHGVVPGQLYAFDANDISNLLWHSEQVQERDGIQYYSKFNRPMVSVGRVYVPTFSNFTSTECFVHVYGKLSPVLLMSAAVYEDENDSSRVVMETLATGRKPLQYQWFRRTSEGKVEPIDGASDKSVSMSLKEWKGSEGVQQYWAEISNEYGTIKSSAIHSDMPVLPKPKHPDDNSLSGSSSLLSIRQFDPLRLLLTALIVIVCLAL